jgi:hypothetical protein
MKRVHAAGLLSMVFALAACGGGGGPAEPAPTSATPASTGAGFGDVAFSTYEAEKFRIVFTTDTKAKKTWANMSGPAVEGTYTKNGNEIVVQWDPAADHHGSLSEKFRQMGPCSLARYERVDRQGVTHDDAPQIYQRTKPLCDTVRITN